MNNNIQNSFYEAMKVFTDYATAHSAATITIETAITGIIDARTGEYSVEYLGNTFTTYTTNSNVTYSVGDKVYVLIPDGDFTKTKVILGKTTPSAGQYVSDIDTQTSWYQISDNLIDERLIDDVVELSSYKETLLGDDDCIITQDNSFGTIMNNYIQDYGTFQFKFNVKTELTEDQQAGRGNYGVVLYIPLVNTGSGGEESHVWKIITLDVGSMSGNPYRFTVWTPQVINFEIDKQYKFDEDKTPGLCCFCYNFPYDEDKEDIKDIFIKDFSFSVVKELSATDMTGYKLTLKASEGEYFSKNYKDTKTITPTLRVNGKETSLIKDNCEMYWFVEDASVKSGNDYYSAYGGWGWKCLNTRTNIVKNVDGTQTFDYITSDFDLQVSGDLIFSDTRYKCVAVYDGVQVSEIITLKNFGKNYINFTIETETGSNVFLKDTGYVTLVIDVNLDIPKEVDEAYRDLVSYSWLRYDKNGNLIKEEKTEDYNDSDFFTIISYNQPKKFDNSEYSDEYAGWGFETKIKFPVNIIEDYNTLYCTAKLINPIDEEDDLDEYILGTKEIVLSTSENLSYILTINNGNQLFKYDSDGDSPAGSAYDGPSTSKVTSIPALTYTLRRPEGIELTDDEYSFVNYKWCVPKNSLFKVEDYTSEDDDFYYFEGWDNNGHTASLAYSIASRYNVSATNNTIILKCSFQGNELEAYAPITFIKEGENGTNGTAYAAELVSGGQSANTSVPYSTLNAQGVAQKLKFLYNISSKKLYRYDYDNDELVELTKNSAGDWTSDKRIYPRVYENSAATADYTISYSMFDYKTTNPCFYLSNVETIEENKIASYGSAENGVVLSLAEEPTLTGTYCNIVQAQITVDGQSSVSNSDEIIYCYYPIELSIADFDTAVVPGIDGGFAEVMYASDGTNPSWDETSAFKCDKEGFENFSISWKTEGHLKPMSGSGTSFTTKPTNKYDDGNSKNMVITTLSLENVQKTKVEAAIKEFQEDIENTQEEMESLVNNLGYLEDFAEKWNEYWAWYYYLEDIQDLLDKQTEAVYKLNDLLEEKLISIDNYLNLQENYNNKDIQTYCKQLTEQISKLKNEVYQAIVQIQTLGNEDAGYDDLISLEEYLLDWNETIKQVYIDGLGLDSALTLEILITDINEAIVEYQELYKDLYGFSETKYLEEYEELKAQRQEIIDTIPDSAMYRCLAIKMVCQKYLDRFDQYTSIKDIKTCVEEMYTKCLKNSFDKDDYPTALCWLTVNDVTETEFNDKIQECLDKIAEDKAQIENLNNILKVKNQTLIHQRPIIFYFNRYEMSNINAWDGNKVEIGDGYILSPQIGAGAKESDNSFTGVVMGLKKLNSTGKVRKGLYAYHKGTQSFMLDAENGAAIFGKKENGGQIIIDPSNTKALLYSGNYFNNYDSSTGLPISYNTHEDAGMCIDLSTPEIRFGTGNFVVNKEGHITAKGGGEIAGWSISDTKLVSADKKTALYSGGGDSDERISVGNSKFVVYGDGRFKAANNNFSIDANGNITSTGGSIGGWTIGGSSISSGGTTLNSDGGINCRYLVANNSGQIGGWTIGSNSLSGGGITLSSGSITGSGWSILGGGAATFGNLTTNGSVSIGGSGNIGGVTLTNGVLHIDRAHIDSCNATSLYLGGKKVSVDEIQYMTDISGITATRNVIYVVTGVDVNLNITKNTNGYVTDVSADVSTTKTVINNISYLGIMYHYRTCKALNQGTSSSSTQVMTWN